MSLYDCPLELVTSILELACLNAGADGSKTARALRLSSKRYLNLATALEFHTLVLRGERQVQRACDRIFTSEPESAQASVKAEESGLNTNTNTNMNTNSVTNGKQDTSTSINWPEAQIHHLFISDRPVSVPMPEHGHESAFERQLESASSSTYTASGPDQNLGLGTHSNMPRAFWRNVDMLLSLAAPKLRTLALGLLDERDVRQRSFDWPQEGEAVLDVLLGRRRAFPLLRSLVLKHARHVRSRSRDSSHGRPETMTREQDQERDNGQEGQSRGRIQDIDSGSRWYPPSAPLLESLTLAYCDSLTIIARDLSLEDHDPRSNLALHPVLAEHIVRYPKLKMLKFRGGVFRSKSDLLKRLTRAICGRQTDVGREIFSSEGYGEEAGEGEKGGDYTSTGDESEVENLENDYSNSSGAQSAEQIAAARLANGRLPGRLEAVQVDISRSKFNRFDNESAFADVVYACDIEGITVCVPSPQPPRSESKHEHELQSAEREYEVLYRLWYTEMEKMTLGM